MPRHTSDIEVTVKVSGPEGATTAVMLKIKELLEDQTDVAVKLADPKVADDYIDDYDTADNDLRFFKPTVVLEEEVE